MSTGMSAQNLAILRQWPSCSIRMPEPFYALCALFAADRKRLVTLHPDGLWGPIVPHKPVKFRDPRLKLSRRILPEAIRSGIFDGFYQDYFRQQVNSEVIPYSVWL